MRSKTGGGGVWARRWTGLCNPKFLSKPYLTRGRLPHHYECGKEAHPPARPTRTVRGFPKPLFPQLHSTTTAGTPPVQVREGHPLARVVLRQQVLRQRAEHRLRAQHQAAQHTARAGRHHARLEGALEEEDRREGTRQQQGLRS